MFTVLMNGYVNGNYIKIYAAQNKCRNRHTNTVASIFRVRD